MVLLVPVICAVGWCQKIAVLYIFTISEGMIVTLLCEKQFDDLELQYRCLLKTLKNLTGCS